MAATSVTDTYGELLTSTARQVAPDVVDNIFNAFPTLMWLEQTGNVRREASGGHQIQLNVNYAKNTTAQWYSGYDQVSTNPQDTATATFWTWKFASGSISISEDERLKNMGDAAFFNLLQHKTTVALESVRDKVVVGIYTDASAEPAKQITPMSLIADDGPTSTVGSVNGTNETWWQNYQADVGAFGTNLYNDMLTAYNTQSRGGVDPPDTFIGSLTAFEYFERYIATQDNFRINISPADGTGGVGFDTLRFKGAKVFFDPAIASGMPVTGETMFVLNSRSMHYYVHPQADFSIGDFVKPSDQHARVALINHMCELTTSARWKQGILHGIDAS